MKKIFLYVIGALLLNSCSDYLDLVPKGSTLLDNADDLEKLLNSSYQNGAWSFNDCCGLTNEMYGRSVSPAVVIANGNGLDYIYMTYDETANREQFISDSYQYNTWYSLINYRNIFLEKIEKVEIDAARKTSLIAEARVMRAYLHYLLVNLYAKQYDAATAANEGGIAYATVSVIGGEQTKQSLEEVYARLLEDTDETILASLPDEAANIARISKALGYAIRAKILFQMKNYPEALKMADKSLSLRDVIQDRKNVITERLFKSSREAGNNLLWAAGTSTGALNNIVSQETAALFEKGDILMDYGLSSLTGENMEIWNTKDCDTYRLGIDGTIYMFKGRDAFTNTGGITCEQIHYLKAECLIRAGQYNEGLEEVNKVRRCRIDPDKYTDFSATNEADAMALLQKAKWIECLFTYNNFFDMKRWNSESAYKRTISRTVSGKTYTLSPESPLWVFSFPSKVTDKNPSMTQNY